MSSKTPSEKRTEFSPDGSGHVGQSGEVQAVQVLPGGSEQQFSVRPRLEHWVHLIAAQDLKHTQITFSLAMSAGTKVWIFLAVVCTSRMRENRQVFVANEDLSSIHLGLLCVSTDLT